MYEIGESVFLLNENTTGKIERINKDKYTIMVNEKYIICSLDNLSKITIDKKTNSRTILNSKQNDKKIKVTYEFSKEKKEYSSELMLRHLTSDEALILLEQFISDSICNRIYIVKIIHGKNGGVIKKVVWDYLEHSEYVKDFRLGGYFEGQFGVTIVNLKI